MPTISENYIYVLKTCLKDYEEQLHMIPELYTKAMDIEDETEMTKELNAIDHKRKELQAAVKRIKQQLRNAETEQHEADGNEGVNGISDSTETVRPIRWVKEVDSGELYPMEVMPEPEPPGHLAGFQTVTESENEVQEEIHNNILFPCEEVLAAIKLMNTHK